MNIGDFFDYAPANPEIYNAFAKAQQHLARCDKAQCAISGGADSDIMLDIVSKANEKNKISYVFFNTGIEYEATKKHLDYLREKYGVEIKEYKAALPVPLACRKYGQPFLTKYVSEMIQRLQRHGFKWEDKPLEDLLEEYPKCKGALRWWCNDFGEKSRFNINRHKLLKEFMIENPPDFAISNKCCDYAKKNVAKSAAKAENCDLILTGVRRDESGIRSVAYNSCFSKATTKAAANFRPLFWLTDNDKEEYEQHCNIVHSDCYTVYGLKRTGCAGCPFGSRFEEELEIIKEYEPKLYGAVNKIFGASYDYMRRYRAFKGSEEQ